MKKLNLVIIVCLSFSLTQAQDFYDVKLIPQQIFKETFVDNANKWPQYKGDTAEILLRDGGYLHKAILREILIPRPATVDLRKSNNYYNLRLETTCLENNASFYGIAFSVKNKGNYSAFLINAVGEFIIREVKEGIVKDLVKGQSAKINTGKSAKNILGIQTGFGFMGYNVSYYVNGSNVQIFSVAEQAAYEVKRKAAGDHVPFSMEEIDAMSAGQIDVQGSGIGLLTTKGAAAIYDNFDLQVMPNKGDIIMYNNNWQPKDADVSYLKKPLQQELLAERNKYSENKKKRASDDITSASKAIAEIPADKLSPPGANGKKFTPNIEAVIWLKDMIFQIGNSSPLGFYPEKEQVFSEGDVVKYSIRQRLPGIQFIPTVTIEKGKSVMLVVRLGDNLSENEVRSLFGQYMVNLYAAAGPSIARYLDPKPDEKELHMIGVSTGGKSFMSDRTTTTALSPTKNTDGTWKLQLIISAK